MRRLSKTRQQLMLSVSNNSNSTKAVQGGEHFETYENSTTLEEQDVFGDTPPTAADDLEPSLPEQFYGDVWEA